MNGMDIRMEFNELNQLTNRYFEGGIPQAIDVLGGAASMAPEESAVSSCPLPTSRALERVSQANLRGRGNGARGK